MTGGGTRLSSRMPAWVSLKLVPGLVIAACSALAVLALTEAQWRGALLLLCLLAILAGLSFGLVRFPSADLVIDCGDHLRVRMKDWQGDIPIADIEAISFRPALNGRVVTLHQVPGASPAETWVFVPRVTMRSGMPAEVQALQQRLQQRRLRAVAE